MTRADLKIDGASPAATATIADLLGQVTTLEVDSISSEPSRDGGSHIRITVSGGTHEILCDLGADGSLQSARVIEI